VVLLCRLRLPPRRHLHACKAQAGVVTLCPLLQARACLFVEGAPHFRSQASASLGLHTPTPQLRMLIRYSPLPLSIHSSILTLTRASNSTCLRSSSRRAASAAVSRSAASTARRLSLSCATRSRATRSALMTDACARRTSDDSAKRRSSSSCASARRAASRSSRSLRACANRLQRLSANEMTL
jgi:hypothetical protein